ncbi:2OG-Fe dioxygenase family protein [Ramlibacter sp. H39-3-26]|uniref:2OG-Fe dioxygenase family protein n=1 Tax=Curvibacter soli TaxID=3031331 RepID=UPI0023DB1A7A|nr:2OG-Fe dioxygenase family protein [Ramlibacter sp. H39-3-26]MDF1484383.1 2OG-Fe dioxygenase family protein [Ramlibacter sp. H39-3-26]
MTAATFSPPFTAPDKLDAALRGTGFAVLDPASAAAWAGCSIAELDALRPGWDDLPPDAYLRDGGRYRRRRHACFVVAQGGAVRQAPHRAHWQPVEYNALHGGMQRWFASIHAEFVARPVWTRLMQALARTAGALAAAQGRGNPGPWFVEAHQFRIDTTDGIGRPTPEGAHRDGVDLVAVFLVARTDIKGGETRVFEADGPHGQRFTLTEPWSLMLLDDARMIHESTPIQPTEAGGHRDTLVLTCRAGGFQGDGVAGI